MTEEDWPIAIDPPYCGCTECLTGEYVPLDLASTEQIVAMAMAHLVNNTEREISIRVKTTPFGGVQDLTVLVGDDYLVKVYDPAGVEVTIDSGQLLSKWSHRIHV